MTSIRPAFGDLSSDSETRSVAEQVGAIGRMDAIIHNAGVYDGAAVLPVNAVARICPPY